jgi:hypothetical protein
MVSAPKHCGSVSPNPAFESGPPLAAAQRERYASMRDILTILMLCASTWVEAAWWSDPCGPIMFGDSPCIYEIDGHKFTVLESGEIEFDESSIALSLPEHYGINAVHDGLITEDSALLSVGISDGNYAGTVVVSISVNRKTINWQSSMFGFNGSPLLLDDGAIYAGAIGTVGKLDASNGEKLWAHTELYEKDTQAFTGFRRPYISDENVVFPENKVSDKYDGIRKVIVNRETGELVSK